MNENFSELIEYLDKKFDTIQTDVKNLQEGFDSLQKSVDAYALKADKYFQEMVMLSHKVDRHEKWLQKIAEKVGVKLEY